MFYHNYLLPLPCFSPIMGILIQKENFTMNDNFSPRVKRIFTYSKEEAVRLGYVTPEDFDKWVRPEDMVGSLK